MKEVIEQELLPVLEQSVRAGRWKTYESYKDSGVEWLGEIPEHWEVRRVKHIAAESLKYGANEIAEIADPTLPRYIRITDINEDGSLRKDTFRSLPEKLAKPYLLKYGDLLFARSGATVGKSFLYQESWGRACYAGYLIRLRTNITIISPRFLSYFVNSSFYKNWLDSIYIQATIQNVSAEKYANLSVPLTSLEEQVNVVAFLDQEIAKINDLIAKKERLIELLQEQRTAIINQAVTRGLNADVPMKDSGVEWLGEIPEHWEIVHLRRIVRTFVDYRGMTPQKVSSGIPLITARNIKNGTIDLSLSQEFIREEDYPSRMVRGKPTKGDVLITTEAPLGETAQVTDERIALAQRIILLKLFSWKMENNYLKYYFLSNAGQGELWSRATGSTAIGIKASHLKEIFAIMPPLEEQKIIVSYLDQETAKIDKLISVIQEGIKKLKEYSTALVSAAVTGKIDVRGEVAAIDISAKNAV
jgi:type I restriction enzyme S subunit